MNSLHTIRRRAMILTGLTGALLAFCAGAAPAAFASVLGGDPHGRPGLVSPPEPPLPQTHALATGGMPGWQIALIVAGAAMVAAATAVLLDRARSARRHTAVPTT